MAEQDIRFGSDYIRINLGDREPLCLLPHYHPPVKDVSEAARTSLSSPIGSEDLKAVALGRKNACIVISDKTRPIPYDVILPPILDTLNATGLGPDKVKILIATGIHSTMTESEIEALVGTEIASKYPVINHNGRFSQGLKDIGSTSGGVPLHVNEHYLEADLRILTGLIEPHLLAGFSGGAKAILPGLCGLETMRFMHGPGMIGHPKARNGIVDGNPFRKECDEVAERVGVDFIVNLCAGDKKKITGVFSGHVKQAWLAGVRFMEKQVRVTLERRPDIVVTSAGGEPADKTLYQSVKAFEVAADIVKPGGAIILASKCSEGPGSETFDALLCDVRSPKEALDRMLAAECTMVDQWIVQHLCQAAAHATLIGYIPGIAPEKLKRWCIEPVASVEEGLSFASGLVGDPQNIAVLPEGPRVIPKVA